MQFSQPTPRYKSVSNVLEHPLKSTLSEISREMTESKKNNFVIDQKILDPIIDKSKLDAISSFPPNTNHITNDKNQYEELKNYFSTTLTEKLSKIDDLIILLNEKQDKTKINTMEIVPTTTTVANVAATECGGGELLQQKTKRAKKTYFRITDQIWIKVKENFPELTEKDKVNVYSDGEIFYYDLGGKKIKLDNKCYLKILNKH